MGLIGISHRQIAYRATINSCDRSGYVAVTDLLKVAV